MKTTDAAVLDEPKLHEPTPDAVVEPAIEGRPRPSAVGIKDAKIYIDGKFYSEADAKISVSTTVSCTATESSRGFVFYNGRVFRLGEHLDRYGIQLARSAWTFQ